MAAGVMLLGGIWRWVAGFSTLLCLLVLIALGMDALYALGLLVLLTGFSLLRQQYSRPISPRPT